MTESPQTTTETTPLTWLPQVATIALAFALSFAMPVGALLTLVLMVAMAIAAGIAGLRRHGAAGVPVLPFSAED